MSNLVFANNQNPLYLSSQGVDVVQFNHNTVPPIGILNKDVLYALDDGKLYFNGSEVASGSSGDVLAPISTTPTALPTWDVAPKTLTDSSVLLDPLGNMTGLSSSSYVPKATQTDPNQVYINDSNNHLWRGGIDLELTGTGDVIAPVSQTSTAIPTWSASANTLTNSTVLLDTSANISQIGTLKMLDKNGITDPNTLWINQLDGHLYRGSEDTEPDPNTVITTITPGSATDGRVLVSSGTTGAYLKEANIDASGGDLAIRGDGKVLKMYDNSSGNIYPVLVINGNSLSVGVGNSQNATLNPNEAVLIGRDNDVGGKLEASVCVGTFNFGGLTGPSLDNVVVGDYNLTSQLTGGSNTIVGNSCLSQLANGSSNFAFGTGSGNDLITGSGNLYLGDMAGLSVESDTTRIGNTTTSRTYIKGVHNQTVNNKAKVVGVTSSGVLEDAGIFFDSTTSNLCLTSLNLPAQNVGVNGNVALGLNLLTVATTGTSNVLVGNGILTSATTNANQNVVVGVNSLIGATSNIGNNVVIGQSSCTQIGATNLGNNVVLGNGSAQTFNGASSNIVIGTGIGNSMTSNSNNIVIGSQGVAAENNSIRVGTLGSHTSCFVQGLTSGVLSNRKTVGSNIATGQLGYFDNMCVCLAELAFENFTVPYARTLASGVAAELAFTGTSFTNDAGDFNFATAGRIQWLNSLTMAFNVTCSLTCVLNSGVNRDIEVYFAINGTKVPNSAQRFRLLNATDYRMLSFSKTMTLTTNQYVSVFMTNLTGNETVNIGSICLIAMECMV